jgi:hypothetical protein
MRFSRLWIDAQHIEWTDIDTDSAALVCDALFRVDLDG